MCQDICIHNKTKLFNEASDLYFKKEYKKCLPMFEKLANMNHTSAQFYLGYMYDVIDIGQKYDLNSLCAAYGIAQFEKLAHQKSENDLGFFRRQYRYYRNCAYIVPFDGFPRLYQ